MTDYGALVELGTKYSRKKPLLHCHFSHYETPHGLA